MAVRRIISDYIKATRVILPVWVLRQKRFGGVNKSYLLLAGDARCGVTESGWSPVANLDEYHVGFIEHHQIQFTPGAAHVLCN